MKIQTLSVLAGSAACNACCPFCVSKMTPHQGIDLKLPEINWRNFSIGCRFARARGVTTALLTGKGEPTLYPEQISFFSNQLFMYGFTFIELQTNGIRLFQEREEYGEHLRAWHSLGLTTIAVSVVHYDNDRNRENYQPKGKYMDLVELISYLHERRFSVRLSCIMFRGGIDSDDKVANLIKFAKTNKVEQLTVTPMRAPGKSESRKVAKWVAEHELDLDTQLHIKSFLNTEGKKLLPLVHGAVVYDVGGQNVCLSDCLTENPSPEEIRQLIFFPDGHLRYDWQYEGAILL